jgi:RecA/RadA recombinase
MKTKNLVKILKKERKRKNLSNKDFLSTGSTLLNLACTNKPNHGFIKGHYHFIVGDSASGKTFLSLTCIAEACANPEFDDYRFIYDNSESGALMDIERFFGKKVYQRMESPAIAEEFNVYSSTIEEFYYHVDDALKQNKPFIYILDSMDSLSSKDELEKFDEQKNAYRKGKITTGSYGDGKAKRNSEHLRKVVSRIAKTNSILIIISQTRDNLGFGFEKKSRAGGHALRFYATLEIWSSIKEKLYKIIKDKKRQIGIECKLQIKKNRITGKERTITVPIYHSFGIDDIGSCVDYLVDEGHWTAKANSINAKEFEFQGKRESLIKYIEETGLEKDLKSIVGNVWDEIEELSGVKRKRRYE